MSPTDLEDRLRFAVDAARAAGDKTLEFFQRSDLSVERKSDNSPVTIADRSAEELLRQRISDRYPEDGIVGEEFGTSEGSSGLRWILDPIDGTKSFICGVPLYGTMVGLECDGQSVLGVVYIPGLREGIFASSGSGAWHFQGDAAPQRARVSSRPLSDGVFVTSQVDTFGARGASDAFQALSERAYVTRTWGDCYGYLLVATGRAELMVDPLMSIWDAAAIQPIMQEAGGTFTDWQGNSTIHSGEGIGTNGHVLQDVLQITRQFPPPAV